MRKADQCEKPSQEVLLVLPTFDLFHDTNSVERVYLFDRKQFMTMMEYLNLRSSMTRTSGAPPADSHGDNSSTAGDLRWQQEANKKWSNLLDDGRMAI